jgi:asparagine synthase (glutamine-hydrolysing)
MCGIAGIFHRDGAPASPARLKAMTDVIAHRGPDGEGQFVDRAVGLGHRRLAVIDLSPLGQQPMTTPDGRFTLVFGGEIYNFRELRDELRARGHVFASRGDGEVLLRTLAEWGLDALGRLNGMFALALWDRDAQALTLARDRYGVKPLYWTERGGCLLFGSEIKALLAHGALPAELDLEGLSEYLTFQNFFTDRTLFRGVRLLPAGSYLRATRGSAVLETAKFWDFRFEEPARPRPDVEYVEETDRLFRQAVARQLVSDVEIGCYLSGGMDSGSITAVAARHLPGMRTFTVGFDLRSASGVEMGFDERVAAEQMARTFGTEHHETALRAGDMERVLPELAWHLEEPRVGQCYPNFYAARLASQSVKVVLSGVGGDELFAGYPWRYYRAAATEGFDRYVDQHFAFWQRLLPEGARRRVLAPVWGQVSHVDPRALFRGVFDGQAPAPATPEDHINHSLYFEAKTFLHGILVVEDKLSMAHGLESRVPFLDNDLVDFAMKLPVRTKLGHLSAVARLDENEPGGKQNRYYRRTRDGKLILRTMMRRHLPPEVADRDKQGFSAPDASWFKGESIDYVRRRLFAPGARLYDVLDRTAVQGLVADHLEGRENRRLLIWSLLNLEQVLERYF